MSHLDYETYHDPLPSPLDWPLEEIEEAAETCPLRDFFSNDYGEDFYFYDYEEYDDLYREYIYFYFDTNPKTFNKAYERENPIEAQYSHVDYIIPKHTPMHSKPEFRKHLTAKANRSKTKKLWHRRDRSLLPKGFHYLQMDFT